MEADPFLSILYNFTIVQFAPFTQEIIFILLLIVLLLFITALISGSEIAFFSLKPAEKKTLFEMGTKNSIRVLSVLKNPEKLLAAILICKILFDIGIIVISSSVFTRIFIFDGHPIIEFLLQVVIITLLIILFGEIIPKIYASRNSLKFALKMSRPVSVGKTILSPVINLLLKSTSFINEKLTKKSNISLEDLTDALDLTTGVVSEDKKILKSLVKFSFIEVSDIMQPRLDIVAVDTDIKFKSLIEIINESGFSRIPVYTDSFDNINGILFAKDLLPFLENSDQFNLQKLIRPCYFVPKTKKIKSLLQEFLKGKIHMAIVIDEYGGTEGIVTLEDIVEEIVGEITDDTEEIETLFTQVDERNYIFDAKTLLNDFYKIVHIPEDSFDNIKGEADTIAGLILEIKGEIPGPNEIITLKNFSFTILSADSRRIKKIRFTIEKPIKQPN